MSRNHVVLVALAFLATVLLPATASASSNSYGFDTDHDRFGWAIVSDGNSTTTDLDDQEAGGKAGGKRSQRHPMAAKHIIAESGPYRTRPFHEIVELNQGQDCEEKTEQDVDPIPPRWGQQEH